MSTSKRFTGTLNSLTAVTLCCTMAVAQSQNQQKPQTKDAPKDDSKATTTKKAGTNPKKPAEAAKNSGDPDKVKTDERMSTRGLKPPPKDDKKSPDKPDSPQKQ